jgi:hypothetical protein
MPINYEIDPEEVKRSLDESVAAIAPHVGDYTHAQVFHREGAWAGEGGVGRFVSKVLGRDKEGPKEPEQNNLVILTPDHLHMFGCKAKGRRWMGTEPIGDWPLKDLKISARHEQVSREPMSSSRIHRTVDTIKVTIEIVPEGRALKLEGTIWGKDKTTETTVSAMLAATGSEPIDWGEPQL